MPHPSAPYDRLASAYELAERLGLQVEPCPFCKSKNIWLFLGTRPHLTCSTCEADGPLAPKEDLRAALVRWNARK